MLDLFCGRWGWSKAFAARGWRCVGVDLVEPVEIPAGCDFRQGDVLTLATDFVSQFDFVCASPPCQQFSKFGMPNFYPDPDFPVMGVRLFNHTREICWRKPHVIENVWGAQQFVGAAQHRCGPYFLWGNSVPPLMVQGIIKGGRLGIGGWQHTGSKDKKANAAAVATIPPELANCVAEYAERLIELKQSQVTA